MGLSTAPLLQVAHSLGTVTVFSTPAALPHQWNCCAQMTYTSPRLRTHEEHVPNLAFPGLSVREALPIPASSNTLSFRRTALSQLLLLLLLLITSSSCVLPCTWRVPRDVALTPLFSLDTLSQD